MAQDIAHTSPFNDFDKSQLARGLSLDGGGLHGLIQLMQLVEIEERTAKPVSDLFHMMAGTSFGGLMALALSVDGRTGRPFLSARELLDLLNERFAEIFVQDLQHQFNFFINEKYSSKGLRRIVEDIVGDAWLSDIKNDVLITTYDMHRDEMRLMKSWHARGEMSDTWNASKSREECDFKLVDVAMGTTAAPTYFQPVRARSRCNYDHVLIDGGVVANHPADILRNSMETRYGKKTKKFILSVGTGEKRQTYDYEDVKNKGRVGWLRPVIDVLFNGQAAKVEYDLRRDLEQGYMRMQIPLNGIPELPKVDFGFDIRYRENLDIIRQYGAHLRDVLAADDHATLERFFRAVPMRPTSEFVQTSPEKDVYAPLSDYRKGAANDDKKDQEPPRTDSAEKAPAHSAPDSSVS